jgi:hypothetical protein
MHDPMTVAFEICYPWKKYGKRGRNKFEQNYRAPFITIWHVDPEKDGSDDSCDWHHRRLTKRETEFAAQLIDNEVDNLRSFFSTFISTSMPCSKGHTDREQCYDAECHLGDYMENCSRETMRGRVAQVFRCYKREFHWHYPVRWHFWHWKLQCHPLQQFKRWAFSRCEKCGGGFAYGESPVTGCWDGTGPLWFRSEKHIYHQNCHGVAVENSAKQSVGA